MVAGHETGSAGSAGVATRRSRSSQAEVVIAAKGDRVRRRRGERAQKTVTLKRGDLLAEQFGEREAGCCAMFHVKPRSCEVCLGCAFLVGVRIEDVVDPDEDPP
jgi:hypothetical protein